MPDKSRVYQPRKPQNSQYYQYFEDNFETLEQVYDEHFAKKYGFFRPYVRQVIYSYIYFSYIFNLLVSKVLWKKISNLWKENHRF